MRRAIVVFALLSGWARADVPAFPGAEGFGTQTPGGRGGRVIEVTTLDDDGPGSLRAALLAEGPRIVVFRVGGTIVLKTPILVSSPFLTVAGQSAPGDGILIRDTNIRVQTHDVVLRYLRCRVGSNRSVPPNRQDGLAVEDGPVDGQTYNVVIDHCSISWGQDEVVGISGVHDVTLQWCMLAEGLKSGYHEKGDHSMALIVGNNCDRVSVHHNLMMSCGSRNPRIQGGLHAIVNNVAYNYGGIAAMFSRSPRVNFIGNCYRRGPASMNSNPPTIRIEKPAEAGRIYCKGNITPHRASDGMDEWKGIVEIDMEPVRVNEPFDTPAITTTSAEQAWKDVLARAGATLPIRDAVDRRLVREAQRGEGKHIDRPEEAGGFPTIRGGPAPADGDHDGMPDDWERRCGLHPEDPADAAKDRDGDGYTNVEEYLNGLVERAASAPAH